MPRHAVQRVGVLVVHLAVYVPVPIDGVHFGRGRAAVQRTGRIEPRLPHPQRTEDGFVQVVVQRLSRDLLYQESERHEPDVGIDRHLAVIPRLIVGFEGGEGLAVLLLSPESAPKWQERRQSPLVGQQMADGDVALPPARPFRQVLADAGVEGEAAAVDELHHPRRGRDDLRERREIVQARIGRGGPGRQGGGRRPIEVSVAAQPDDPVSPSRGEDRAGGRAVRDRRLDDPVHAGEGIPVHPHVDGPLLRRQPHAAVRDRRAVSLDSLDERQPGLRPHAGSRLRASLDDQAIAEGVTGRERDRQAAGDRRAEEGERGGFLRGVRPAPGDEVRLRVRHRREQVGAPEGDEHGGSAGGVEAVEEATDFLGEVGGVPRGAGPDVGGEDHGVDGAGAAEERVVDAGPGVEPDPGAADAHRPAEFAIEDAAGGEVVRSGEGHGQHGAHGA